MPDLPTPQDAAEAALFSECWDAVLSYADLCTSGSAAAAQLATEAFTHGIHQARATETTAKNTGRRTLRLPRVPLLLTAVRTTAAAWEAHGQGHRLDPDLRLWLNSDKAARYTGPPLHRPLALRGLRDMQEPDAALLWLAEVESLPLPDVARRLGLDPTAAAEELIEVRALFRDRCHRNHLDTPMKAECRSYARLLDAVTRSPNAGTPDDLSRHLATCVECAEAAACLRLHGGGLPSALAGGVIGWGGLAYLERRRRAADAGLSGGRVYAGADTGLTQGGTARPRIGRTGILVAAVIVSALALGTSLMQFGDSGGGASATDEATDGRPLAGEAESLPAADLTSEPAADSSSSSSTSRPTGAETEVKRSDPDTEPQGKPSSTVKETRKAGGSKPTKPTKAASYCQVKYEILNEWPDGFQATVTVTSQKALDNWRIGWTFRDGQQVSQMWDASVTQSGARVTAAAADYNKQVAAGATFAFGFLSTWHDENTTPYGFTLNGGKCTTTG
ncbi:cellulose binding domain-containing protein [Streptomyces avermitilis]|uniref:cellulose binding domain-containing protein n=1 Tax=Streptomyces avermitilis TaxID=33903 RepID=UPI00382AC6A3